MTGVKTKHDYQKGMEVIRAVIHEWDPYGLLASGAPQDEFDSEVASVVRQISRIKSENDAAHVLSRVFSSSFEAEFFEPKHCLKTGTRLYQALKQNGLL